jgi:HAMP domain-containing protein
MFNRLAPKIIIPVAFSLTGFVIVCSFFLYASIKKSFISDAVCRETSLANTVVSSTRYSMMLDDRKSLYHIIDTIGSQEGVEHLRIFNKAGVIKFSADHSEINHVVDKTAAGCTECHSHPEPAVSLHSMELARRFKNERGHDVLAITVPIYNDTGCSAGECHFHPPQQKILGTLDIGLATNCLDRSLLALRVKMIIFCLMILVLSVGGVTALLKRKLLVPIEQLIDYAKKISRGELHHDMPRGIKEIETLAKILLENARGKDRSA